MTGEDVGGVEDMNRLPVGLSIMAEQCEKPTAKSHSKLRRDRVAN